MRWRKCVCLQVLRKAKLYIKKHEGELKQSKQTKDIMAKYRSYMEKVMPAACRLTITSNCRSSHNRRSRS